MTQKNGDFNMKYSDNQIDCPHCPKCGSNSRRLRWDQVISGEAVGLHHSSQRMVNNMTSGHPALAALGLASMGAKMALSSTYECIVCDHKWRKWF
jgi:hypothetical protein